MADSIEIIETEMQLEVAKEDDGATDDNIEYYYLRITDPDPPHSQVLVYLDTSEQKMLYDPITFQTDYKSNYSVVIAFKLESPNVYTISSGVLPDNWLIHGGVIPVNDTIYRVDFKFEEGMKFTELQDPNDSAKLAYYTQIDNDPTKRAYLLPVPDPTQTGNRSKIVRAVLTSDQTATDKYVFEKELIDGYTPPYCDKQTGRVCCLIL